MFPMTADPVGSQLGQLPRGRHGLSPEAVTESQRGRILTAMVEVTAERGYADSRIADVIAYAGVSRKTFYELFSDKEECFLAAYDLWLGRLFVTTAEAFDAEPDADWAGRVRVGLASFLQFIADHPAAAGFCIVEVLAAGPKALARRDAGVRQFTAFIDAGRAETSVQLPESPRLRSSAGSMSCSTARSFTGPPRSCRRGYRSSCSGSSTRSWGPSGPSPSATVHGRCSLSVPAPPPSDAAAVRGDPVRCGCRRC